MMPMQASKRVIVDRLNLFTEYLAEIRKLPLEDQEQFMQDKRNIWSAESCLGRSLEALLDIGRHILAKGYGKGVTEYKEIATNLRDHQVLSIAEAQLLFTLAGYRNRMVHYYHEITADELYQICTTQLKDSEDVANAFRNWMNTHPEMVDTKL